LGGAPAHAIAGKKGGLMIEEHLGWLLLIIGLIIGAMVGVWLAR
jgi:hypothetical protein